MPPPPIQLFLTTIASQPALRKRQEYVLRVLQVKKVQFTSYDLASDEDAKKLWRRKAPLDKQQLPGLLVGGEFPGTFQDFEDAVEFGELDQFLRLNEDWKPLADDNKPLLRAVPVGIPGAYSPAQMNPEHISPAPSPIKTKPKLQPREGEVDAGETLGDASLQGVNVTDDDLLKLVEELGLDEASASDLVKGLSSENSARKQATPAPAKEEPSPPVVPAKEAPVVPAKEDVAVPEDTTKVSDVSGPAVNAEEPQEADKTAETTKSGETQTTEELPAVTKDA